MAENTTEPRITVTGEERPHPALRKLGRACIALVRWQREQAAKAQAALPAAMTTPTDGRTDATTTTPPARETGAAHE